MPAPGVVLLVAVVLIVLALVYYLVSTILQLRKITHGLDDVIVAVGEIVEKSAPVNDVVDDINAQPRRGRRAARGHAREEGRHRRRGRPRRRPLPGSRGGGIAGLPRERRAQGAAHRRGLHEGHAHARTARPRGADRHGHPGRPGAQERRGRQPRGAGALPRRPSHRPEIPAAVARDRHRRARAVRAARGHRRSRASDSPAAEGAPVADPRAIRVRARDQRRGRDRGARAARPRGAGHRGRSQPAADDEAAARQPRAPDRHQRPRASSPTSASRTARSGSGR